MDGASSNSRASTLTIVALFMLGAGVRLYFVFGEHEIGGHVSSDMWVYDHRARNLLAHSLTPWDTFTPVGYPALLACLYYITDKSHTFVGFVQSLAGGIAAVLTFKIGLLVQARFRGTSTSAGARGGAALPTFWSTWPPVLAGLAMALHVPAIFYAGLLLTETFFGVCLLSFVWWSLGPPGSTRSAALVKAGLALGFAACMRPNLVPCLLVLPLYFLSAARANALEPDRSSEGAAEARNVARSALSATLVVLLAAALPMGIAVAHQSRIYGRMTPIGTNGGLNFYLNFSEVRGVEFEEGARRHGIFPIPNLLRYERVELVNVAFHDDRHYYARGFELIREQPARLLRSFLNFKEASGIGEQGYWPGFAPRAHLFDAYRRAFFFAVLAPAGAYTFLLLLSGRLFRPSRAPLLLLVGVSASSLVSIYAYVGDPRLRVPFDPLFILLAVHAYRVGLELGLSRARRAVAWTFGRLLKASTSALDAVRSRENVRAAITPTTAARTPCPAEKRAFRR